MKESEIFDEYLRLKSENLELKTRLAAKKYKMIDDLVVFVYKFLPFVLMARSKQLQKSAIKRVKQIKNKKNNIRKRKISAKRVYIVNFQFYDYEGKTVYLGGAERYVCDLSKLLTKMGYNPILLQFARKKFEKEYNGVKIVGIEAPKHMSAEQASAIYNSICADAEFIIASPMELAVSIDGIPTISINHGINFDTPKNDIFSTIQHNIYAKAVAKSNACVCVDTNFMNWIRTNDYYLTDSLYYVPNYYEPKDFKYKKRNFESEKIVCVYPRRIYAARGYDMVVDAFTSLIKKYGEKIELRFVGQIDNDKARYDLENMMKEFPTQVKQYAVDPNEMPNVYADADIALVPTRYSEGTSLSCIEAMASGCVVVATNVGGLPNTVIDHYNGLLIEPNAEALETAVNELLENRQLMRELAKNGVAVAKAGFQKELWDMRWEKVINRVIGRAK